MTYVSKHSRDNCSGKATFGLRLRLLGCNFTEHLKCNFENTKRFNLSLPIIAKEVTYVSKHSRDNCLGKATFGLRLRLLGCNFTEHLKCNFENTKRTMR